MSEHDSGTILDGKYEILDRLGAGGMGEVYKARHIHLQELRVIKILRSDRASDPTAAQRFLQEARTATQIKHPNVAILYDFSRLPDGRFYMVWEHIQGEDVGNWLRTRGPLPLQLAVELGIQGLRGLEAIHAAGVIHRDLSPDNLMVTRDGRGRYQAKIIDLGLAKNLTNKPDMEITQAGMFMGKLRYCSPEQAGALEPGQQLDHRSDIYSFAAVLYEMISGLPPFDSENQHGFVLKRLNEDPLPLEGRNPQVKVPRELDAIVRKGLERDRDRRYPDAIAFIQALARFAERLKGVETQELKVTDEAKALPVPAPGSGAQRAAVLPAATARPQARELSREERIDLLAQIERVGKREPSKAGMVQLPQPPAAAAPAPRPAAPVGAPAPSAPAPPAARPAAPAAGKAVPAPAPHPADALLAQARVQAPAARPAPRIDPERQAQIHEAEQMLERYVGERKQQLASLALETLIELAPQHPRRAELEQRVAHIGEETARIKRAETALAAGREAVARGDLRAARQRLEELQKNDSDGKLASELAAEITEAEQAVVKGRNSEQHRRAFENLMSVSRYADAEKELEILSQLEVTKVTIDHYRLQLEAARKRTADQAVAEEFERRFRALVEMRNWLGARGVVQELQAAQPDNPRPVEMIGEITRLEERQRRQESIEQGVKQVDAFIDQRRPTDAELALKILLQMDPENVHKRRLERQIAALWKG